MTDADPGSLLALARPLAVEVAGRLEQALEGAGPTVSTKSSATDLVTELVAPSSSVTVSRTL